MKYKVGDKTLLGEIDRYEENSCYCCRVENKWWLTEPDVDKIISKPKRNIDHVIELWDEGKRKDAVNYFYNCARFSSAWEDIAILGELYIEPSKDPKLTPQELKAIKWLSDGGYTGISIERTNIILHIKNDQFMPQVRYFPIIEHLIEAKWLTCKPLNLKNLLDAQEVEK